MMPIRRGRVVSVCRAAGLSLALAVGLPAASSARGEVLTVPTVQHPTIQSAIADAVNGDEVLVGPGVYNETIRLLGKTIRVRSSHGPGQTILDATGLNNSAVKCIDAEGRDTILLGFTITGGTGEPVPGTSESAGGGLLTRGSSPTVANCVFRHNSARGTSSCMSGGGGAYCFQGAPLFVNCVFEQNAAEVPPGCGGAIHNVIAETVMVNCTFYDNVAGRAGGVIGGAAAVNSIFWGNEGWPYNEGAQVFLTTSVRASIIQDLDTYLDNNNVDADPLFVDPENGNLRLMPGSPAINSGSNMAYMERAGPLGLATDLDGNPRFVGIQGAVGGYDVLENVVDIGAFEFGGFPGDLDHDGDVDLKDTSLFVQFFTGP